MTETVAKQLFYTTSLGYEANRLRIAPRSIQTVSGHKQRSEAELRMTETVAKQLFYTIPTKVSIYIPNAMKGTVVLPEVIREQRHRLKALRRKAK